MRLLRASWSPSLYARSNSIAAASLFAASFNAQAPTPHHEVIDAGKLGGEYIYGYALNNAGAVVGRAATPTRAGRSTYRERWAALHALALGAKAPELLPAT